MRTLGAQKGTSHYNDIHLRSPDELLAVEAPEEVDIVDCLRHSVLHEIRNACRVMRRMSSELSLHQRSAISILMSLMRTNDPVDTVNRALHNSF
jgi:hypothetical protein